MTEIAISKDDKKKIDDAEQYLIDAQKYQINDETSFHYASDMLKQIKLKKNEFDEMRKTLKKPINEAAKAIEDFFRAPIGFLGQAETTFKTNILKYQKEHERLARDIREKNMITSKELSDNAIEALKANDYERYAEITLQMSNVESTTLTPVKAKGMQFRDNWKGRVTDMNVLLLAIIDKQVPITVLKVDESTLNQLARSLKNTVSYPGIEFYNDRIVSVKAE